ncbi:MAG: Ig-like domain-containing protein [Betaproteobacteria bacterium]|nr:Ig-like domain-containing protein [Betaproteobacteria bacterium]
MTMIRRLFSIVTLLALAACGGGGGSAGTPTFGSGSGTGTGGTTPPGGSGTVQVTLSSSDVTSASPATVTATVRDASGSAVANAVVTLSTGRGNLATLSVGTALTDALGVATATLSSAASGVQGADEVVAATTVGTTQVQGRAGFNVRADSPTISISPSSTPLRFSTGPVTLSARVLSATGTPVPNQLVGFAAANGLVRLNVNTALTNGNGDATVTVQALSGSTSGAEIVTASTTVAGRDVQALASLQLTAESPSVTVVVPPNSTITSTTPTKFRVAVRGLTGALLPGTVVTFSSGSNLASFTPGSAVTDASGEAETIVSPRTASSNGADTLSAAISVQGVAATAQRVVQFSATGPTGTPTLDLALSTNSISAATPASVSATLRDAQGNGVPGQVVTFSVARGLAVTNVVTALTQSDAANLGKAVVLLSPANSASAGADDISASVSYAGVTLSRSVGFQVQATPVTLGTLSAAANPLSAYGQTTLTLPITGASVTSPVNISVVSACVTQGKATLSPSTFTATSASVSLQYRDNGCGAVQTADQIQAVVTATGAVSALSLAIQSPAESSIAFVSAAPEQIFLKGSGFAETSVVTFEVRDSAGNQLPGRSVELRLQTGAGGVTMEGRGVEAVSPASTDPFTLTSNAQGRVSVRVNSGTLPTPVRVNARLAANTSIATVSSNLSVAVGLPSQLNFSLSQGTKNIEGYNIDGTTNTYQIIAADRSGNPVPTGTSINFVTEGGQIEAIKQTQLVNGIARTVANFVSSEPRPVDGRVTVTAYTLGEESFLDLNGNNAYDPPGSPGLPDGEPFQDLGGVFKDRNFDGIYDASVDEFILLGVNGNLACATSSNSLLQMDASIPSWSARCDRLWSGAGQVYVRRAAETVISTSAARPLWVNTTGLSGTCQKIKLQTGPSIGNTSEFIRVAGDTYYGGLAGSLNFIVADANPGRLKTTVSSPFDALNDYDQFPRLNPMAAGTTITATTPTTGLTVTVNGGSPVPSTTEATFASIGYNFTDTAVTSGIVFVNFRSPSGLITTVGVALSRATAPSPCPAP